MASHAADVGQLTSFLDDPEFLVAAEPAGLFAALQRPGQPASGNAQIYRNSYSHLQPGADMAGERAGYLQLAARRHRGHLADQLDQLPLHRKWTARWLRGQLPDPHYIVGRHDGGVSVVAVGERRGQPVIISAGSDRTVRVWDPDSGQPVLGPLAGHDGTVYAVAVGERRGQPVIISAGSDRTVRVWDLDSGKPTLRSLTGHHDTVYAMAVGERLHRPVIVSGSADQTIRVWDLDSGKPILGALTGHQDSVYVLAIGERRGRPVIVSGSADQTIRVWDLDSGKQCSGNS